MVLGSSGFGCTSLECVLAEAAVARGIRRLEQLCASSAQAREEGGAGVEAVARSAAAMLELERLAGVGHDRRVDLGSLFSRIATLVQLAADGGSTMATRVAGAEVPAQFARGIAAAVLDLFHVVGSAAEGQGRPSLILATSIDAGDLVVTVAAPRGAEVPDAVAARCMERAGRIARLLGGRATRGLDGDLHLAGVVCPLPLASRGAGA